jgi:hypothetical protein
MGLGCPTTHSMPSSDPARSDGFRRSVRPACRIWRRTASSTHSIPAAADQVLVARLEGLRRQHRQHRRVRVNLATRPLAAAMNETSASIPSDHDDIPPHRIRSRVLRCTKDRATPGRHSIERASGKARAIHAIHRRERGDPAHADGVKLHLSDQWCAVTIGGRQPLNHRTNGNEYSTTHMSRAWVAYHHPMLQTPTSAIEAWMPSRRARHRHHHQCIRHTRRPFHNQGHHRRRAPSPERGCP